MDLLRRIFWILLLSSCLLQVLYSYFLAAWKHHYRHKHSTLSEVFEGTTHYDLLMLGTSRMQDHNNPRLIDSITHWSSFNAGIDGGRLADMFLVLNGYLQQHPAPRYVLLNVEKSWLASDSADWLATRYVPYCHNRAVDSMFVAYKKYNIVQRYVPFTRIMLLDDHLKKTLLGAWWQPPENNGSPWERYHNQIYRGYFENGIDSLATTHVPCAVPQTLKITQTGVHLLEQWIQLCHQHNIGIIFTYTPEFHGVSKACYTNLPQIIDSIDSLAYVHNIPFLRYEADSMCYRAAYFTNFTHLNRHGARVYSERLGRDLVTILRE
jgi:hypothetical protein